MTNQMSDIMSNEVDVNITGDGNEEERNVG